MGEREWIREMGEREGEGSRQTENKDTDSEIEYKEHSEHETKFCLMSNNFPRKAFL